MLLTCMNLCMENVYLRRIKITFKRWNLIRTSNYAALRIKNSA